MGMFTDLIRPEIKKQKETVIKSKDLEIDYNAKLNETHVREATEHGLTLLHRSNSRVYGWFKNNKCGHTSFLHYGAIRKAHTDEFKCAECLHLKLQEEASKVGVELISRREPGMKNDERRYKLACGCTPILKTSNVRTHTPVCVECTTNRYIQEARDIGLKLVHKLENNRRLYELPCGHTKELSLMNVRRNSWKCRICQENSYELDALKTGIKMNRNVKAHHHDYRNYTLPCGCSKDIAVACVKRCAFECKNHSERFIDYSKKISVYLVKFKLDIGDFVKVGFAMDVQGRFQRYGLIGEYESVFVRHFENGQDAVNLEKSVHSRFHHLKADKELMRNYMVNGFTECYPIEHMSMLLEVLNE